MVSSKRFDEASTPNVIHRNASRKFLSWHPTYSPRVVVCNEISVFPLATMTV
jgi:hypothetical protein